MIQIVTPKPRVVYHADGRLPAKVLQRLIEYCDYKSSIQLDIDKVMKLSREGILWATAMVVDLADEHNALKALTDRTHELWVEIELE